MKNENLKKAIAEINSVVLREVKKVLGNENLDQFQKYKQLADFGAELCVYIEHNLKETLESVDAATGMLWKEEFDED